MPTTTDGLILCDTNIIARSVIVDDAQHELVSRAAITLLDSGYHLLFTPQSLREFWNVATRPLKSNGFGLSIVQADELAREIETHFEILQDTSAMHDEWRRLVVQHEVKGIQVHDARLAASALVGGCRAILTLNDPDFRRFGVEALHPRDVASFLSA